MTTSSSRHFVPRIALAGAALAGAALALAGASARFAARPAAPEILFTPLDERGASFTADENTVVYVVRIGEGYRQVLCIAERRGGRWGEPRVLPFSGRFFDADPFITPDGGAIYFATNQAAGGGAKGDLDIWVAERQGDGWAPPHPLPGEVNTPAHEMSPVLARSGTLYFASSRGGGADLYTARPAARGFGPGVPLGDAVNSPSPESQLAVSPDERTIVFTSSGRPDIQLAAGAAYDRSDLYLTRRAGDGWSAAARLGAAVNTHAAEYAPSFSADGRVLYFVSERGFATEPGVRLTTVVLRRGLASSLNGSGNVYRIGADVLAAAR